MKRPDRKRIPVWVKKLVVDRQGGVCVCGCGQLVSHKPRSNTHFDHEPALILRGVNKRRTDYIPPQLSPRHIDARCPASHRIKTSGAGATTAGTDVGKMKKERKRNRRPKIKCRWAKRKFPKRIKP